MSLYEWLTLLLGIASAVVLPLVLWGARLVWQIRQNDLGHLQSQLDCIREDIHRLVDKIDEHLRDHTRPGEWTR